MGQTPSVGAQKPKLPGFLKGQVWNWQSTTSATFLWLNQVTGSARFSVEWTAQGVNIGGMVHAAPCVQPAATAGQHGLSGR